MSAGSHRIYAVYNGKPGQFRASTSEPVIQQVNKLKQKIIFKLPSPGSYPEILLKATADPSNLPVSFSSHSNNCSIEGDKLKITGQGMCVVKASQTGNDAYYPAHPVIRHLKIKNMP